MLPDRLIPQVITNRINSPLVNRAMRPLAGRLPGLGIVIHEGRTTGREFRTPVSMFVSDGRVVVPLAHGDQVNWVRNVLAAQSASVRRLGRTSRIVHPRVVAADSDEVLPHAARVASQGVRFFIADIA